jgi:hypothetical protein
VTAIQLGQAAGAVTRLDVLLRFRSHSSCLANARNEPRDADMIAHTVRSVGSISMFGGLRV